MANKEKIKLVSTQIDLTLFQDDSFEEVTSENHKSS